MNPDFQAAAVSYFGLPEGTTLIPSDPGYLAFHVVLDAATLTGIGERMRTMAEVVEAQPVPVVEAQPVPVFVPDIPQDEMRARYNQLSARGKASYGSFARYCSTWQRLAQRDEFNALSEHEKAKWPSWLDWAVENTPNNSPTQGTDGREVTHVDAAVEEDNGLPDAVWVPNVELTLQQTRMASDRRKGECLMQVIMLDDAQKAKYAPGGAA